MLLQKYEEDSQFDVAMAKKKMDNNEKNDKLKQAYYDAKTLYTFISQATGAKSPAKKAEEKRKVLAAEERASN